MLYELKGHLPGFKGARFGDGLNVVIAQRSETPGAAAEGSGRVMGKTDFVRVLDFLLGSDVRAGNPLRRADSAEAEFGLTLDLFGQPRTIVRGVQNLLTAQVNGASMRMPKFRAYLGKALFGLTGSGNEPTFRTVAAYYLRDVGVDGFASPTETYRKQRGLDTRLALAYLFALDVDLVAKVGEVRETDRSLRELRKAAKETVMGMTLGRGNDLDARIRTLQIQREALAGEIAEFRVVERYAQHRERVDELSRRIREINDHLVVVERKVKDIEQAISEDEGGFSDRAYLQQVFEQLNVVLPDLVTRRFEEVEAFHRSVVANRRRYLEAERVRLVRDTSQEREKLAALDRERAELMRLLAAGGAFETYSELQRELSVVDGRIAELVERRAIVDRWVNTSRHLQLHSAELELQVNADLHDRRDHLATISRRYASYAYQLYGDKRPAALTIEAKRSGYKFVPTIGGESDHEVRGMTLFCFDLCMAVTAKRAGHGPDFLVHDGHLFDHADAHRVAGALRLASEVCRQEGMQYVTTIDADRLDAVLRERPDLDYHLCMEMPDET
ncbi:ABC-three component system protein [Nonomuraea sp. NPDC052116]|uniref:ABC-three component system protein n=1 Tax=Nonomuraea sp. NPDC052116 TaxID=3155665 RepID=UPI0034454C73